MRVENHNGARCVTLADGEVTGHAHRAFGEEGCVSLLETEDEKDQVLQVLEPVEIIHEEHGTVKLPSGEYQCGIVREQDHFTEEARSVAD